MRERENYIIQQPHERRSSAQQCRDNEAMDWKYGLSCKALTQTGLKPCSELSAWKWFPAARSGELEYIKLTAVVPLAVPTDHQILPILGRLRQKPDKHLHFTGWNKLSCSHQRTFRLQTTSETRFQSPLSASQSSAIAHDSVLTFHSPKCHHIPILPGKISLYGEKSVSVYHRALPQ